MLLGIDPGMKNLGQVYARPSEDNPLKIFVTRADTLDVSSSPEEFVKNLDLTGISSVGIERYVPYNGVHSTESENIVMLIGGLRQKVYSSEPRPELSFYRAIDWKIKLCQLLAKHCNFNNPSTSLDKKFSKAAAKCIVQNHEVLINDHIADAACICAIKYLERKSLGPKP